MKYDEKVVRSFSHVRSYIDPPLKKHVVGAEDEGAIYVDIGACVEPFENQVEMFTIQKFAADFKATMVFPVGILNPLQLRFVVGVVGVWDQAVFQEVGMHHAGNFGRSPDCRYFVIVCALPKLPSRVEGDVVFGVIWSLRPGWPRDAGQKHDAERK
jgi:hypothetical protein